MISFDHSNSLAARSDGRTHDCVLYEKKDLPVFNKKHRSEIEPPRYDLPYQILLYQKDLPALNTATFMGTEHLVDN